MTNSNCYLTLRIEDASFRILRCLSERIAEEPSRWLSIDQRGASDENAPEEDTKECIALASRAGRGVEVGGDKKVDTGFGGTFDAQADLHITFVFFGEALASASKEAIQAVYATAEKYLAIEKFRCRARNAHLAQPNEADEPAERHLLSMRLRKLELFPPEKQNLIIAELDFVHQEDEDHVRQAFTEIHRCLRSFGVVVRGAPDVKDADGSGCTTACSWRPHVTLGKIRATKQQIARISLSKLNAALNSGSKCGASSRGSAKLDDVNEVMERSEGAAASEKDSNSLICCERDDTPDFPILSITGFGMGGIPPKRQWCNWEALHFCGRDVHEISSTDAEGKPNPGE